MARGNHRPSGRLCFSTRSLAHVAARSSSPSLRGPPMPRTKKASGGATRFPPLPFRRLAILGAAYPKTVLLVRARTRPRWCLRGQATP
jgi:hypothetical protein